MNGVEHIRARMAAGQPSEGDASWCIQRLRALAEWPERLDENQVQEIGQLAGWLATYFSNRVAAITGVAQ